MIVFFNIKRIVYSFSFFLFFLINNNSFSQQISLAGVWRFAVDRDDVGINEMWFNKKPGDVIKLPGTMAENRKGDDVTLQTKWTGSIYDSSFSFVLHRQNIEHLTILKFLSGSPLQSITPVQ